MQTNRISILWLYIRWHTCLWKPLEKVTTGCVVQPVRRLDKIRFEAKKHLKSGLKVDSPIETINLIFASWNQPFSVQFSLVQDAEQLTTFLTVWLMLLFCMWHNVSSMKYFTYPNWKQKLIFNCSIHAKSPLHFFLLANSFCQNARQLLYSHQLCISIG